MTPGQKRKRIRHKCKSLGIGFNLSLLSVRNLKRAKSCFYTGLPIVKLSIDRVDNSKGYVKGNVVACEEGLNQRKGDLSVLEIQALYKGLQNKGLV